MADVTSKYVSTDSLKTFLTTLAGKYAANTNAVSDKYKVNWAQNAVAATKATNDGSNNNIESTYVKQTSGIVEVQLKNNGDADFAALTKYDATGGKSVKIDLSSYALKSEVASAMDYKGSASGTDLAAKTPANTRSGDVYTCSADSGNFHAGLEYVAVVSGDPATVRWEELGKWVDLSGYVQKKTSGVTAGNIVTFTNGGDIEDSGVAAVKLDGNASIALSGNNTDHFTTGADVAGAIQGLGTIVNGVQIQKDSATPESIVSGSGTSKYAVIPVTDTVTDGGAKLTTGEAVYEYATKVMNAAATPAHVNVLNEANSTDIAGIFTAYEA